MRALLVDPNAPGGLRLGEAPEPEVVLGPDGEPLADWEVDLMRSGGSAAEDDDGDDDHDNEDDDYDEEEEEEDEDSYN